jgi:ATP-binding cassette, subfamily B, bacterial PglK
MIKNIKEKYKKLIFIVSEKNKKTFISLLYLSVIVSIFEVLGLGILMTYILSISNQDILFNNEHIKLIYDVLDFSDDEFLILIGVIIGILYIVKSIIALKFNHMNISYSYSLYKDLSSRLVKKYLHMPFLSFAKRNSSDMIKIIMTDATHVSQIISKVYLMVSEIVIIIFLVLILMFINIKIVFFIVSTFIVFFFVVNGRLSTLVRKYGKLAVNIRSEMFQNIDEVLLNNKINRVINRESYCVDNFKSLSGRYGLNSTKGLFLGLLPRYIVELLAVLIFLGVIIGLIYFNKLNAYLPIILIFLIVLLRLLPSFFKLLGAYNQIKYQAGSINSVYENLNITEEFYKEKKIPYASDIIFKNVQFSYNKENTLRSVNLKISKGSNTAIMGESGSGKSTIVSLLCGFIYPDNGGIYVDNNILSVDNIKDFRSKIGYVPQEVFLIDGTIAENIILNRPYNKGKLDNVIFQVNLTNFIKNSKLGLETKTGQNGVQISGGQKQRIGIARALYGNPELLILDEATSALNNKMEAEIMNEVFAFSNNITLLVVTHKLNFINKCNNVNVMIDGVLKKVSNDNF